ncbi:MAG TPA: lipoyl synthase [Acidobacteriota bacterium]
MSELLQIESAAPPRRPKPEWLRIRLTTDRAFPRVRGLIDDLKLHTVCAEARCPNIFECYSHGTATFMLMGDTCTRGCRFCAVGKGQPAALDPAEPERVAEAVARMGLRHAVITSVNRDDLADGGAAHFAATIGAVRRRNPATAVEVLIPDLRGAWEALDVILAADPDVLNHNTETVPRLYQRVRPGARYQRSLELIRRAAAGRERPAMRTKSGLMLGLGERPEEVLAVAADLSRHGCEVLTLGQYLQPTAAHLPVERYVPPAEFAALRRATLELGFLHVESGPLVRSSYHAHEHV